MVDATSRGKRRSYRIDLGQDLCVIGVRIATKDGVTTPGWVFDVSTDGVGVRVPTRDASRLCLGETAEIAFVGERVGRPLTLSAVIRDHRPQDALHRIGLEFVDRRKFEESAVSGVLHALFNRRGAIRVGPEREGSISVTLEDRESGTRGHGGLLDLSVTGVAVLVSPKVEARFRTKDRLTVTFGLPDESLPLHLEGAVSYRTLDKKGVRYGLVFDPARSEDFEKQEAAIHRFVLDRGAATNRRRKRPALNRPRPGFRS